MLGVGAATRIYVATGATDMRLGFNGLYGLVRERLECDPTNGHLYLFANSRRDRMKIFYFDGSSLWVCATPHGRRAACAGQRPKGARVQLSREEFALLLGGIDLRETRKRKWYRRPVGEEPQQLRNSA